MKPQQHFWAAVFSVLFLTRASAVALYVSLNSSNPVPPYAGWSTAATNIQDAIDAASAGDQIWVNDGVYGTGGTTVSNSAQTNRVAVNKAVIIQSVNGPAMTVIDGGREGRCVYLASGATLAGVTLTNGWANSFTFGLDSPQNSAGGGVCCESRNTTVSNCVISGNSASGPGGGAYGGTLINCMISYNAAPDMGGGADMSTLIDCTLVRNNVHGAGGGAVNSTLNNCTLTDNFALDGGGGAAGSTLNNCTLTGNEVDLSPGGGAIDCTLNNCVLTGNGCGGRGGGAAISTLNNCILTGNFAADGGGGAAGSTMNNCTLTDNSVGRAYSHGSVGGGAYHCTLANCTLTGNSAASVLYNSKVSSNIIGQGGGAAGCTLYNCTLTGNSAEVGGGVSQDDFGNPSTLHNCIVLYNSDTGNGNYDTSSTLNYCCTTPLPPSGVGNIAANPLFVDTNGWSNLRLQPGSPCINAGNNDYVSTATDLDGYPRIIGGTVDMGAYEFWTPALLVERLIGLVNQPGLRHQQPLLATLAAAQASLHRGNSVAAVNQLAAFENKVGAQVAPSDTALAQALIAAAQQVIEAITPNANP